MATVVGTNAKGWPAPIKLSAIVHDDTITLPTGSLPGIEVVNEESQGFYFGLTRATPAAGTIAGGHTFNTTGSETNDEKKHFPLEIGVEYTLKKVPV